MYTINQAFKDSLENDRLILRQALVDLTRTALAECFAQINRPLKALGLSNNNLKRLSLEDIEVIMPKLTQPIKALNLSDNELALMDKASLLRLLQLLPSSLNTLYLNDNQLGLKSADDLMEILAAIPQGVARINLGTEGLAVKSDEELAQIFKNIAPNVRILLELPFPRYKPIQTTRLDAIRLFQYLEEDLNNNNVHPVPAQTGKFIEHLSQAEKDGLIAHLNAQYNDPANTHFALSSLVQVYLLSPAQNFYELAYNHDANDNSAKKLSEQVVSLLLQTHKETFGTTQQVQQLMETMLYIFKNASVHESVKEQLQELYFSPDGYIDIGSFKDDRVAVAKQPVSIVRNSQSFFASSSEGTSGKNHNKSLENSEPEDASSIATMKKS